MIKTVMVIKVLISSWSELARMVELYLYLPSDRDLGYEAPGEL